MKVWYFSTFLFLIRKTLCLFKEPSTAAVCFSTSDNPKILNKKRMRKSVFWKVLLLAVLAGFMCASCSSDDDGDGINQKPTVVFNNQTGIYTVKIGREVTLKADVKSAVKPVYTWKQDGKIVETGLSYTFEGKKLGSSFLTFRVDAKNGVAEEEVRVDVVEKTPPVVSLPVPEGAVIAYVGTDLTLAPTVLNCEGASYEWTLDKKVVGSDSVYVFNRAETGDYALSLTVTNEDGSDKVETTVRVIPIPEFAIAFPEAKLNAPVGRVIYLEPAVSNAGEEVRYKWEVDESPVIGATDRIFSFTPTKEGEEYQIKVTATAGGKTVSATALVLCVAAEGTFYRPSTVASSTTINRVYDFIPAPGQFVGQCTATTQDQANDWAKSQFSAGAYVSLGGFGGYIVVGFDHSIDNKVNDYDFGIEGNSFAGSSEPAVVWVMQDENGDGLPNDTWYELKGSEAGKPGTRQNYALTYFKPKSAGMPVAWSDTLGNSGTLDLRPSYPSWIKTASYKLRGTCLIAKNTQDPVSGNWTNADYEWGYADNFGSDLLSADAYPEAKRGHNYFKVENAVAVNGSSVNLQYIDFIKVQVGVNAQSGWLGEISTEVLGFSDYKMKK